MHADRASCVSRRRRNASRTNLSHAPARARVDQRHVAPAHAQYRSGNRRRGANADGGRRLTIASLRTRRSRPRFALCSATAEPVSQRIPIRRSDPRRAKRGAGPRGAVHRSPRRAEERQVRDDALNGSGGPRERARVAGDMSACGHARGADVRPASLVRSIAITRAGREQRQREHPDPAPTSTTRSPGRTPRLADDRLGESLQWEKVPSAGTSLRTRAARTNHHCHAHNSV
jgi:hypothetical protein